MGFGGRVEIDIVDTHQTEPAEFFWEETRESGIAREDGIILVPKSVVDAGVSVRIRKAGAERYACRSGRTAAAVAACADAVGAGPAAIPATDADPGAEILASVGEDQGLENAAVRRRVLEWLEAVEGSIRSRRMDISCRTGCDERIRRVAVLAPGGSMRRRTDLWATARISIRSRSGEPGPEGRFHAGGGRGVAELLGDLDPGRCADSVWADFFATREAMAPPGGDRCAVVFTGPAAATLFHEICGHFLEADVDGNRSEMIERLNDRRIIPAGLQVYDDPTVSGFGGSRRFDDEGTATGRIDLVRDGRMIGLLVDTRSARRRNLRSTGSGMRASYRDRPLARLGNLFVRGGHGEPGEAAGSCSDGILVESAGRGSLHPRGGGFTLAVDRARRIRCGRPGEPLRPFLLSGSMTTALEKLEVLESDAAVAAGTGACSKEGQWLLVGQSAPPARIAGLQISGSLQGQRF
jgi:TldD protein